jgi:hypothetical protein
MIRKALLTTALTAGLIAGSAGVASAHECFNASRSDKGNAGATHSAKWETLTLEHLYSTVHGYVGGPALSSEQVAQAVTMAKAAGVPASFTVFHGGMLPANKKELGPKASDGKGIDHFASGYGDILIGIYFQLVGAPAAP